MKHRSLIPFIFIPIIFSGCGNNKAPELTPEELQYNALVEFMEKSMTNEEKFTDLADYRYYARTIGLEKDGLVDPGMWEIFYNEDININKDIDGKATYLIRLDPYKLMDIWAENNEMTAESICEKIGTTPDELYFNFGYTSNSIDYAKEHKNGKVSYPDIENEIFGEDNGENRNVVFGTHFIYVDTANKYKVTYASEDENLAVRQRDFLQATTPVSHNYSDYTYEEMHPTGWICGEGIRRVLKLDIPNMWSKSIEKETDLDASLMFNMSPYSYGCKPEDIVVLYPETTEETSEETEVSE